MAYQDWILEDWKKVIWIDETSVVLNFRRGGYRVWRKADEVVVKTCIRKRWKGYSEFIFWGSFSYNMKGLYYYWELETVKEKEVAKKEVERMNEELEPLKKEQWVLQNGLNRLSLRNLLGRKPEWK